VLVGVSEIVVVGVCVTVGVGVKDGVTEGVGVIEAVGVSVGTSINEFKDKEKRSPPELSLFVKIIVSVIVSGNMVRD